MQSDSLAIHLRLGFLDHLLSSCQISTGLSMNSFSEIFAKFPHEKQPNTVSQDIGQGNAVLYRIIRSRLGNLVFHNYLMFYRGISRKPDGPGYRVLA